MTAAFIVGLKRLVGRTPSDILYECRRCGTNVDHERDCCPACGATAIAQYDLSRLE